MTTMAMLWRKLWQYIFPRRFDDDEMTRDELYSMDTDVEEENTFEEEGLMVENGDVVGETAFITEERQVQPTGISLPSRYAPLSCYYNVFLIQFSVGNQHTFDADNSKVLLLASQCVAFLIVEFEKSTNYGTAVFIDEKHLLTAGHCLYDKNKRTDTCKRIRVVTPGLPYVDYGKLQKHQILTIDCSVVTNLFKGTSGPNECDIALLHAGTTNGPLGIHLSSILPPAGAIVDVIGYPGVAVPAWLKKKLDNINDINETIKTVRKLLPDMTLTISRGSVESIGGNLITYNVSTVPGMSGSCLLFEGRVIGIFLTIVSLTK